MCLGHLCFTLATTFFHGFFLLLLLFYDPCWNYYICQSHIILDDLLLFVVRRGSGECLSFRDPLGDEKALYLFITHVDLKLLGNNDSFPTRRPGSWCVSAQPPSASYLKALPSWTPVFLILCPHSRQLGHVPAGCDRKQARCLNLITVAVWFECQENPDGSMDLHMSAIKCN